MDNQLEYVTSRAGIQDVVSVLESLDNKTRDIAIEAITYWLNNSLNR